MAGGGINNDFDAPILFMANTKAMSSWYITIILASFTTMTASLIRLPSQRKIGCQTLYSLKRNHHRAYACLVNSTNRAKCSPVFIPNYRRGHITLSANQPVSSHSNSSHSITIGAHSKNPEPPIESQCTISEALQASIRLLEQQNIPEPEESAIHLLSFALGLSWETGFLELREIMNMQSATKSEQVLSVDQITRYNSLLERRLDHEPIQYIIGKWDFHLLSGLSIRKPMLCPRPETEELVELVLKDVRRLIEEKRTDSMKERTRVRILDVGAGTGAIGIALAKQYPNDVQVVALDLLQDAIELSNQNADMFLSPFANHDTKKCDENSLSALYQAILCSAENFTNVDPNGQMQHYNMEFDVVVSNPPYIPSNDMNSLSSDVLEYESHAALCGGPDGLDVIRTIIKRLPEWMKGGKSEQKYCWMEVDHTHPLLLANWLAPGSEESIKFQVEYCESQKDFCGRDRFVKLRVL